VPKAFAEARQPKAEARFMKRIRYSKYVPDPAGEMSMEDLLSALSDYLLQSGFQSDMWYEMPEGNQTLDDLKRAIEEALMNADQFDEEMRERMLEMAMNGEMDELIEKLIERMQQEDYISIDELHDPARQSSVGGQTGQAQQAKFEITDKSLDSLGFKALRNMLESLGKSSIGRHDTRDLTTRIETSGSAKTYEFGDTLNLDITATLSSAIQREGLTLPLNIEYSDLQVHQCEYQSSCATVLMLDCSHSMILYGEDHFTPAKKVALALTELILTKYPKDSIDVLLFGGKVAIDDQLRRTEVTAGLPAVRGDQVHVILHDVRPVAHQALVDIIAVDQPGSGKDAQDVFGERFDQRLGVVAGPDGVQARSVGGLPLREE